jgi:hypothetical protein
MLSKSLSFLVLALILTSCGAQVDKKEVKTFVLGLKQGNESFKPLIKHLIEDYNTNVGQTVLEFSETMDGANSPILITKGLEQRDGKVGWGQWFASTERSGTTVSVPGVRSSETTRYSLQVEFDEDFLATSEKEVKAGELSIEVRKLFAHEVGHGFQLQHVVPKDDVMYCNISGEKDFSTYWPRVRAFFGGADAPQPAIFNGACTE